MLPKFSIDERFFTMTPFFAISTDPWLSATEIMTGNNSGVSPMAIARANIKEVSHPRPMKAFMRKTKPTRNMVILIMKKLNFFIFFSKFVSGSARASRSAIFPNSVLVPVARA